MTCRPSTSFSIFQSSGLRLLSRLVAAVLGGYLLTSAWVVWCGALGPMLDISRAEAVLAGIQWGFVLYPGIIVGVFSPVSLRNAWLGVLLAASLFTAGSVLLFAWGG